MREVKKLKWKSQILGLVLLSGAPAQAGFFEISANGSYFKYNNGLIGGEPSTTTITKYSGGIGYHLAANTSLELSYTHSENNDFYALDITGQAQKNLINKNTKFDNLSLNLVLTFTDRGSKFRPYLRGGAGYMERDVKFSGTGIDNVTGIESELSFAANPIVRSASAEAGIGFKFMLSEALALDASYTVYATDLDKPEIYLHYSAAGGFRIIF